MWKNTLLICAAICASIANAIDFGVGFELTLDYGVASVYFSNGTVVDVAKIEGSALYKNMMRLAGEESRKRHEASTTTSTIVDQTMAQGIVNSRSLRDHLPPWLGGYDETTKIFTRMLKSLKIATEAYTETSLLDVKMALPFEVKTTASYRKSLPTALISLSLDASRWSDPWTVEGAGQWAAEAHGLMGDCNYYPGPGENNGDPERLILTVEYSRAATTAFLLDEWCGVYEERRMLHDTELGADAIARQCRGLNSSADNKCLSSFRQALRDLTRLPLETGNGEGITVISELVLHGDSTHDPRLHDVLMEVFGEREGVYATVTKPRGSGKIEPIFAAARGLARGSLEWRQNREEERRFRELR